MPFYDQTAEVVRPGTTTNRAGEQVVVLRDLESLAHRPWEHLQIRPRLQSEREGVDRAVIVSEWTLASRHGDGDFDVDAGDVVKLPSGVYAQVVGEPSRPIDPVGHGGVHHVELLLRQVAS
jgi:hypothetical protein